MSSDPFADLSRSITRFSEAVASAMSPGIWVDGSPAQLESDPEELVGEWAEQPSREVWSTTRHAIASGLDHLDALAHLLPTPGVVLSLSTVSRGALEAFALAFYLSEPGIGQRERVRRWVNLRLVGAYDTTSVLNRHADDTGFDQARLSHAEMVSRFVSTARRHGFEVRNEKDRGRPAYLETRLPSATRLCDDVVSNTTGLGATYFSLLSSVAHSRIDGLTSYVQPILDAAEAGPGELYRGQMGISSTDAALRLMAAPLAAVVATSQVLRLQGFGVPDDEVKAMLFTWARIAEVPHPAERDQHN